MTTTKRPIAAAIGLVMASGASAAIVGWANQTVKAPWGGVGCQHVLYFSDGHTSTYFSEGECDRWGRHTGLPL